jgi:hypothetical protein
MPFCLPAETANRNFCVTLELPRPRLDGFHTPPRILYVASVNNHLYRMFEQFSRGYYLGRLYVEASSDDQATLCKAQHEHLNEQLYASGEGVERVDRPLVMKVGTRHLPVHGDEGVPADTLSVPESVLDGTGVRNPPTLSEVLLAKADRASQLFALADGPGR